MPDFKFQRPSIFQRSLKQKKNLLNFFLFLISLIMTILLKLSLFEHEIPHISFQIMVK